MQEELEVLRRDRLEALEGVQQVEGILEPRIVGVAFEGAFEVGVSHFDVAQAQLVQAEQTPRLPGGRVELDRSLGACDRLCVSACANRQLGERRVERRIPRVDG